MSIHKAEMMIAEHEERVRQLQDDAAISHYYARYDADRGAADCVVVFYQEEQAHASQQARWMMGMPY